MGAPHSSGDVEGLGDQRRKALDQHARHEDGKHEVRIRIEDADSRAKVLEVQPGRWLLQRLEKVPQWLGRLAQAVVVMNACGNELVQFVAGQRSQLFQNGVELRVADERVGNVLVGECLVLRSGLGVTAFVGGGKLHGLNGANHLYSD